MKNSLNLPIWSLALPVVAMVLYFISSAQLSMAFVVILSIVLIAAVMAAVHHAEVVAHKVGEPFGTLVLAVAITVIEVSLIVSLMLAGGETAATLARDTVFAAVMIILTGIIGVCLLVGGYRFHEQTFGKYGVNAALVTLTAIIVLTLVLPNYTTSIAGPIYSNSQLIFVAIVSLVLYLFFVKFQAGRHRDYFLPPQTDDEESHAEPPSNLTTFISLAALIISLTAVVLLAKKLSPTIEAGVVNAGAPKSVVGIIVALVILLPESFAAVRAARNNRLQTSLNLALGSALASIGLSIPAVAIVSIVGNMPVTLGIDAKSVVLMFLALFIIMLSFNTGKTTAMQGITLLVIFATYLFLTIVP